MMTNVVHIGTITMMIVGLNNVIVAVMMMIDATIAAKVAGLATLKATPKHHVADGTSGVALIAIMTITCVVVAPIAAHVTMMIVVIAAATMTTGAVIVVKAAGMVTLRATQKRHDADGMNGALRIVIMMITCAGNAPMGARAMMTNAVIAAAMTTTGEMIVAKADGLVILKGMQQQLAGDGSTAMTTNHI